MKKYIVLMISVLFLFGCGKTDVQELSCSMTRDSNGVKIQQEILATYDDEDKLENLEMIVSTEIPDESLAQTYIDSMRANAEKSYANTDSVSINTKQEGNVVSLITNINYRTFSENDSKVIAIDKDTTKEELKQKFENMGYTCK